MKVPEKHRAVAHAWVDGAEVECFNEDTRAWVIQYHPNWYASFEYRINKPKPLELAVGRKYMDADGDIFEVVDRLLVGEGSTSLFMAYIIDEEGYPPTTYFVFLRDGTCINSIRRKIQLVEEVTK